MKETQSALECTCGHSRARIFNFFLPINVFWQDSDVMFRIQTALKETDEISGQSSAQAIELSASTKKCVEPDCSAHQASNI